MTSVAVGSTFDLAANWRDVLRRYTPKAIAQRIGASPRTIDNWRDGENGPTWKYTVAMLNDDELCARLLEAAGRRDLAKQAELIALNKRLESLNQRISSAQAAENRHRKESHEIKESLGALRVGRRPNGRSGELDSGAVQPLGPVVPGPSE